MSGNVTSLGHQSDAVLVQSIGGGGGVYAAVPATVNNSLFEHNTSAFNGGGMTATGLTRISTGPLV